MKTFRITVRTQHCCHSYTAIGVDSASVCMDAIDLFGPCSVSATATGGNK